MEETSLLFLPEGMRIEQIQLTENGLVIGFPLLRKRVLHAV